MKLHTILLPALLVTAVVVGCQRKRFEVVMHVTDTGVHRAVSVWLEETVDSNGHSEQRIIVDDAATAGLAAIYGDPEPLPDGRLRFSLDFAGDLPSDLVHAATGNCARVQVIRSPLGTSVIYVERMPGRTDMLAVARAAEEVCDLLVAAWGAYAARQPEFRDAPEQLGRLEAFLGTELRADMLNLGLASWLEFGANDPCARADSSSNGFSCEEQWTMRVAAYLLERGYLRTDELAGAMDDKSALTRGVARRLATAIGLPADAPLPPTLEAFASGAVSIEDITSAGLTATGRTTEDLETRVELIVGGLAREAPTGTVTWTQVPGEPATNGRWDAQSQTIIWNAEYREGAHLPEVLYAKFAEGDEASQREHLGKVVGSDVLTAFNVWFAGLSAEERATFKAFYRDLRPGEPLKDVLAHYDPTAPGGKGPTAREPDALPIGIRTILNAL